MNEVLSLDSINAINELSCRNENKIKKKKIGCILIPMIFTGEIYIKPTNHSRK